MSEAPQHSDELVFLIGAGRSGTTLLYKLLCLHDQFAYICNSDKYLGLAGYQLAGRWRTRSLDQRLGGWFNASGNAYRPQRSLLKKLSPMPVEGEFLYSRCGVSATPDATHAEHAYRRLGNAFGQLLSASPQARLFLSKRTANNRRLADLASAFPQARFINLNRDGRDVALSLSKVEWWSEHTLWWNGCTPADLEKQGADRLSLCARNWLEEVQAIDRDLNEIAPERVMALNYEDLLSAPEQQLGSILHFLGLQATPEYFQAIETLQLKYTAPDFASRFTPEELNKVNTIQGSCLSKLGYTL